MCGIIVRGRNSFVYLTGIVAVVFIVTGCTSLLSHKKNSTIISTVDGRKDVVNTIKTVSEAIVGRNLSKDEAANLTKSIVKDRETQVVIKEIGNAVIPGKVRVKYSPATGKRYSADMEYCPETGVKLLPVE